MMQGDARRAMDVIARVFPRSKWTAEEWGVMADQLRSIDLEPAQVDAVIRNHRAEHDGWTPKMKSLVDGFRRARAQTFVKAAKPVEQPHYLADDRTADEARADREKMAERIRVSMGEITVEEWERLREHPDRHIKGAVRIGRAKWATTSESDIRQFNVLMAWGAVMRWRHGEGWTNRVWGGAGARA